MERPAHVLKRRKPLPDWLREGVFIVVSIALAFGVDEYRERRANNELVTRVLTSVEAELKHNLAEVDPYLEFHRRWADALEQAAGASGNQRGLDVYVGVRPALPPGGVAEFPTQVRRGAWDAAVSTGALRFIDYDLVAALSDVYQVQQFYGETIDRLVAAVTAMPAFDPATRTLSVRQMSTTMNSVSFAEQLLLDRYRKHLPAIRAALER
jgi:hypothetical protein